MYPFLINFFHDTVEFFSCSIKMLEVNPFTAKDKCNTAWLNMIATTWIYIIEITYWYWLSGDTRIKSHGAVFWSRITGFTSWFCVWEERRWKGQQGEGSKLVRVCSQGLERLCFFRSRSAESNLPAKRQTNCTDSAADLSRSKIRNNPTPVNVHLLFSLPPMIKRGRG